MFYLDVDVNQSMYIAHFHATSFACTRNYGTSDGISDRIDVGQSPCARSPVSHTCFCPGPHALSCLLAMLRSIKGSCRQMGSFNLDAFFPEFLDK